MLGALRTQGRFLYFEILIPFVLVLFVYAPVGMILIPRDDFLFYKVFGTADLLGICLAVFISTYADLDEANTLSRKRRIEKSKKAAVDALRSDVGNLKAAIFVFGIIVFAVFLAIKVTMLQFDFPRNGGVLESRIVYYSWSCAVILVASVVLCCVARKKSLALREV